jgi:hypothetical protein
VAAACSTRSRPQDVGCVCVCCWASTCERGNDTHTHTSPRTWIACTDTPAASVVAICMPPSPAAAAAAAAVPALPSGAMGCCWPPQPARAGRWVGRQADSRRRAGPDVCTGWRGWAVAVGVDAVSVRQSSIATARRIGVVITSLLLNHITNALRSGMIWVASRQTSCTQPSPHHRS